MAKPKEVAVITPQRLEGVQLQELNVHSVADALRYFSGVQIKDYGGVGGLKTVDMRSMGSHHLGVFYDGIEVGNAQNGTVDLGKFSLENIEELSLYNGQRTEIFQSAKDYGSAGALYIRTRRPCFRQDKNYNIEVGMKAGSFGLANPSFLYEQRLTDNIHLSVNAEYTFATGKYHFKIHKNAPDGSVAWDTTGIRQNGDIQAVRAEVGLFGYLPDGKWHVKGYYYQSEKGIPRAIVRNVWTCAERQWERNAFVQGNFTKTFGKKYDFQISAKYSNNYMRYRNPDTTRMYVDNRFWQQEVYITVANKYSIFPWWDVALSGDYQFNYMEATLANFANPQRHTGLVALATAFHYRWIAAQASVLGTFVRDEFRAPDLQVKNQKPHFTPAVFVSYQPWLQEQFFLRAFYKNIFRMPTFNDLYYTDIGNIRLEPEYTMQADGGFEYTKEWHVERGVWKAVDLHLKADGYFNTVKNKIIAVPKGNSQYRWMMMNIGYVEIRGCDINAATVVHFEPGVDVGINLNYTYQKAQDFTRQGDITYGGQISYVPLHSGSVIGSVRWNGLSFHYSFIYVGERYHTSANIPANYEQPWYTHDMKIGKLWNITSKKFQIDTAIEINNLFNQQYEVILNYPMPGINGKLIVKFII